MQGDFLVRKSSSSNGYVLCVHDSGQAINYTINVPPSQPSKFEFTGSIFDRLEHVIAYTVGTPLKSVVRPQKRLLIGHAAVLEPWFDTGLGRVKVEMIVAGAPHGGFMVRLSSSRDKYVLVVNDKGTPCSYSITLDSGSFVFGGIKHATLPAVIEAMKVTAFKSQNTYEMTLTEAAR